MPDWLDKSKTRNKLIIVANITNTDLSFKELEQITDKIRQKYEDVSAKKSVFGNAFTQDLPSVLESINHDNLTFINYLLDNSEIRITFDAFKNLINNYKAEYEEFFRALINDKTFILVKVSVNNLICGNI